MNPYASYLGSREAREVIAETEARLSALLQQIGPDRVSERPAPGKWSAREVACHLADCELVFAFRLRQILAEPNHVIQPFDQDRWAETYAAYDAPAALAVFGSVRRWNIALIESLQPAAFETKASHPERGEMTFQIVIDTMAGHDLNHLQQLQAMIARSASGDR